MQKFSSCQSASFLFLWWRNMQPGFPALETAQGHPATLRIPHHHFCLYSLFLAAACSPPVTETLRWDSPRDLKLLTGEAHPWADNDSHWWHYGSWPSSGRPEQSCFPSSPQDQDCLLLMTLSFWAPSHQHLPTCCPAVVITNDHHFLLPRW